MLWFGVWWHLLGAILVGGSSAGLMAGAVACGVVLVGVAISARVVVLRVWAVPYPATGPADRFRVVEVPRQRDPDAAGRSRPRAPGPA